MIRDNKRASIFNCRIHLNRHITTTQVQLLHLNPLLPQIISSPSLLDAPVYSSPAPLPPRPNAVSLRSALLGAWDSTSEIVSTILQLLSALRALMCYGTPCIVAKASCVMRMIVRQHCASFHPALRWFFLCLACNERALFLNDRLDRLAGIARSVEISNRDRVIALVRNIRCRLQSRRERGLLVLGRKYRRSHH